MRANYDRNIGWKSRSTAFSKPQCGRPVRWRSSMCSMLSQPLPSPWRDGPHGRGVIGATRRRDRPDLLRPEGETGHSVTKHGRGSGSGTGWFRFRQLAFRGLRRRFRREDDHSADQCGHAGHRRGKPCQTALRDSLVTAEANRSRPSLGITRSGHTRPQGGTMASIDEDELCAIHLGSRLESRPGDADPPAA
jgi:hypothetical protein